ncbi:MAG: RsmE family RNA methyltransferase [Anaerolineae bacterium]|nr:RsmE family RNA methyltransferase [Anaerolineae bacterium]
MYRFFVPPETVQSDPVLLTGQPAHRIGRVLRMQPGDRVLLLDNSGWAYETELTAFGPEQVEGHVVRKVLATGEPRAKISLYQALLKGDGFERVLEKCTEVGVVEFVPLLCQRCIVGSLLDVEDRRRQRWERIIRAAAEQSRRGRLPRLAPVIMWSLACERARRTDLSLLPWEEAREPSLRQVLQSGAQQEGRPVARQPRPYSISLFIGPEGGLTREEVQAAQANGVQVVTLGPRILRAETAGLVAATAILYALGDLE